MFDDEYLMIKTLVDNIIESKNYELKELLKRADEQQYIEKRRFHKERR